MTKKPARRKTSRKKPGPPSWSLPDPRPSAVIMAEEELLTKPMLAKVLGYKSVRTVDFIVAEDCASESPTLRPVYLRRPPPRKNSRRAGGLPSFKSLRFRREDVAAYIQKMQTDFPADLEWKFGKEKLDEAV